jgi:hypothetical protein
MKSIVSAMKSISIGMQGKFLAATQHRVAWRAASDGLRQGAASACFDPVPTSGRPTLAHHAQQRQTPKKTAAGRTDWRLSKGPKMKKWWVM